MPDPMRDLGTACTHPIWKRRDQREVWICAQCHVEPDLEHPWRYLWRWLNARHRVALKRDLRDLRAASAAVRAQRERLTVVVSDPDLPGPWGISTSWYTPEWAASVGLPSTCDRCGLPFDRTGGERHIPVRLQAALRAEGRDVEEINTYCPRFLGRNEMWTCEGMRIGDRT